MFVSRRMQRNVVTVSPSTSLLEARDRMRGHNVHQLPVVWDDRKLLGILSDRDIRGALFPVLLMPGTTEKDLEEILRRTPVETVMTRKVVTATLWDTLEDAIVLLHDFRINSLPVVDDMGRIAGIISRTDVLKAFIEALGIGEISSRIEVLVPDRPGTLAEVVNIIKSFHVNVISVLTGGNVEPGYRAVFFRVRTLNVVPIRKAIEEAGFRNLDPATLRP